MEQSSDLTKFASQCADTPELESTWRELVVAALDLCTAENEQARRQCSRESISLELTQKVQCCQKKYETLFGDLRRMCKKIAAEVPEFTHRDLCRLLAK